MGLGGSVDPHVGAFLGGGAVEAPPDRDCLYDGLSGLATALAEIGLAGEWNQQQHRVAVGDHRMVTDPAVDTQHHRESVRE
jgi:hypothetical protein